MVEEVAILNQHIAGEVEDLDVKIGFATWVGGAPLLLCWLFLIVIRGSVGEGNLWTHESFDP
jgi:hypothetical protein